MKFSLACITLLAVFAMSKADTAALPNFDAQSKQLAESLDVAAKKFEEITNMKTDFDKEKFLKFLKNMNEQLAEQFKVFTANLEKNSKNVPEDLKKKYEDFTKQLQELTKNLSSADVKAKAEKLQETFQTSVKKVGESVADLSKNFGLIIPPAIQNSFNDIFVELNRAAKSVQEKSQKILESVQEELKKKKN